MKSKTKKKDVVFSTGDESLATLGEELRRKYPELVEKMEKFQVSSDRAVEKLVDTLLELFPYEWRDRQQFSQGVMFCAYWRSGFCNGAGGSMACNPKSAPAIFPPSRHQGRGASRNP